MYPIPRFISDLEYLLILEKRIEQSTAILKKMVQTEQPTSQDMKDRLEINHLIKKYEHEIQTLNAYSGSQVLEPSIKTW